MSVFIDDVNIVSSKKNMTARHLIPSRDCDCWFTFTLMTVTADCFHSHDYDWWFTITFMTADSLSLSWLLIHFHSHDCMTVDWFTITHDCKMMLTLMITLVTAWPFIYSITLVYMTELYYHLWDCGSSWFKPHKQTIFSHGHNIHWYWCIWL